MYPSLRQTKKEANPVDSSETVVASVVLTAGKKVAHRGKGAVKEESIYTVNQKS